nr:GFA family protein [Thalassobius sp. Cn5-15]
MTDVLNGSCACGQIQFTCRATPKGAAVCHCSQCRKMSGHAWASAHVPRTSFEMTGPVKWLRLSEQAERGICPDCGSFLFWVGVGHPDFISFALGSVDGPTGVALGRNIFVSEKADYYPLNDGLIQER